MSQLSSDIILIGAGRHPKTKQLRAQNGYPRRTFYIGEIHIRTGLRFPVNIAFVQKYFEEISRRISDGTLLVEYKMDKFVDIDELKTLAYGSDAEKQAYEEEISGGVQKQAEAMEDLKQEKRDADREASHAERDGDEDAPIDPVGLLPPSGGALAAAASLDHAGREQFAKDAGIDVEGLKKEPEAAARQQAEDAAEQAEDADRVQVAQGETPDNAEQQSDEEAEYVPSSNELQHSDDNPDFKPLPADWHKATKPELLSLCAERNIDTSDMPSNKVLKQRLDKYGAGGK